MIRLYDQKTGSLIGELNEQQLQFLKDHLEEESATDQDYYINRTTLELFEEEGIDAGLLRMLQGALQDREEMDIRWEDS